MYYCIQGRVLRCVPGEVVLEAGGVGYRMAVPLFTYEAVQGQEEARLYTHLVVREDSQLLFGLATEEERDLFEHLLTVPGVGPGVALRILSTYRPAEFAAAVADGDVAAVTRIKGLGKSKAEVLVASLRKSMTSFSAAHPAGTAAAGQRGEAGEAATADALSALLRLGYRRPVAEKVLSQSRQALGPDATVDALLRDALRRI